MNFNDIDAILNAPTTEFWEDIPETAYACQVTGDLVYPMGLILSCPLPPEPPKFTGPRFTGPEATDF